jgi:hypothetical protein
MIAPSRNQADVPYGPCSFIQDGKGSKSVIVAGEPLNKAASPGHQVRMADVAVVVEPGRADQDFSQWLAERLQQERTSLLMELRTQFDRQIKEHHASLQSELIPFVFSQGQHLAASTWHQPVIDVNVDAKAVTTNVAAGTPAVNAIETPSSQLGAKNRMSSGLRRMRDADDELHKGTSCACAKAIVRSWYFEPLSIFFILANAVSLAIEVEYMGLETGYELRLPLYTTSAENTWPSAEAVFIGSSVVFTSVFGMELILRCAAMQRLAIMSGWIWFDFILVCLGCSDILSSLTRFKIIGNTSILRIIRLARILRLMKTLKSRDSFQSLFLLIRSIQASVGALFWSFCLLFFIMLATGMLINQLLQNFFVDGSEGLEARRQVFEFYGTFIRTMITMFEVTLGNYMPPTRALINNVSMAWGVFLVVYRCVFCFAVINVIRAVFIAETSRVASGDDEVAMMNKARQTKALQKKLTDLFIEFDESGDGNIEWTDFQQGMNDTTMTQYMSTLELESGDLETLFHLLDDGDGHVGVEEFINGVKSLKGTAKSIDMASMLKRFRGLEEKIDWIIARFCKR